jgi:hypothetical protein
MGLITVQSTVRIPAIFRTRASIMELARALLGERRNLTKGLFSYMPILAAYIEAVAKTMFFSQPLTRTGRDQRRGQCPLIGAG